MSEMTTAQALGRLRRELLEEGFDSVETYALVQIAAKAQVDYGFAVRSDD